MYADASQNLAEENLTLFLHCFSKGHPALQATTLHILCDIVIAQPSVLESAPDATAQSGSASMRKQLLKPFSKGLKAAHAPEVQTAATVALCKLLLLQIVSSPAHQPPTPDTPPPEEDDEAAELLRQLATAFFDAAGEASSVRDNPAARQALSYFLPAFAHARADNAASLARVAPAVLYTVAARRAEAAELDEYDDDNDYGAGGGSGAAAAGNKVSLKAIGEMLLDWTDPRKAVVRDGAGAGRWDEAGKKDGREVDGHVHLVLAEGALERLLARGCEKDEAKALLSMVGKLFVSAHSEPELSKAVLDLAKEAVEEKVAPDATSRNALNKFVTALEKAIATKEGKEKPSKGRKSVAASNTARQSVPAEMTTIKEEAEASDETKIDVEGSGSGGDGDAELPDDQTEV